MGLLDDAIREHLELRRKHGADPSEVASKEHEALGPEEDRGPMMPREGRVLQSAGADEPFAAELSSTGEPRRLTRWESPQRSDDRYLSQETVELDMQAIWAEDSSGRVGQPSPDALPAMASAAPARALR